MKPQTFYLHCILWGTLLFAAWEWAICSFVLEHASLFGNTSRFEPWQTAVMLAFFAGFVLLLVFAWIYGKKHLPVWRARQRLSLIGIVLLSPVTGYLLFSVLLVAVESIK